MGSITFQVTGDASVGTKSKAFVVSDADVNRLVAYATAAFATPPTVGNPTPPALTVAQALLAWAQAMMNQATGAVTGYERSIVAPPPTFTAT